MKHLRKILAKTTNLILVATTVAILFSAQIEMIIVFFTSLTASIIFTLTKK